MKYGIFKNDYTQEDVATTCIVNENKLPILDGCTLRLVEKSEFDAFKFPEIIIYNASTFLAWCMSEPLQTDEFQALDDGIELQAITYTMRFGDNANNDGATLYRQAALVLDSLSGNTVCSEMAETIIAKAIELGANIEEV